MRNRKILNFDENTVSLEPLRRALGSLARLTEVPQVEVGEDAHIVLALLQEKLLWGAADSLTTTPCDVANLASDADLVMTPDHAERALRTLSMARPTLVVRGPTEGSWTIRLAAFGEIL